jgi:hypothetical protein
MEVLVPQMLDDMCRLVVDPYFEPINSDAVQNENKFELIYREARNELPAVN